MKMHLFEIELCLNIIHQYPELSENVVKYVLKRHVEDIIFTEIAKELVTF